MAGNRTELVLSTISKAISDVDEGMTQSCTYIEEALLMRLNTLKNRQERTAKGNAINLNYLRKKSTPLLDDVDKEELAHKKRYATLAVLNITAHYGYACAALEKILSSIRQVVIDNFNDRRARKEDPVIAFRPHTLGAIKPPNPSQVILGLERKLNSSPACLDSATVSAALEAVINEADDFRRENSINNAFDAVSANQDMEPVSRVVEITGDTRKKVIEDDISAVGSGCCCSNLVFQRPAQHGVEWRPPHEWSYPFQNLWGDNTITIKTLSTVLTETVIPNIELANFVLYMCDHVRAVIKSLGIILFDGQDRQSPEYFQDEQQIFSDWRVWLDLHNKLEWFMLASRYVIFLHSKKEMFLHEKQQDCPSLGLLAAAVESIPPNLLALDWVQENLFSWPSKEKGSGEPVSAELLLSLSLRTSPGARHSIFGTVNQGDYAITNRISVCSANFCARILLGRALDEEDAGTKMMVSPADEKNKKRRRKTGGEGDQHHFLGGALVNVSDDDIETCCSGASPFVSNPTYYFKKVWNMETHDANWNAAVLKRENAAITSAVLEKAAPLMFLSGGGDWTCLRLLGCCQAPALIHKAWTPALKGGDVSQVFCSVKSMAEQISRKAKVSHLLKGKASLEIDNFLSGHVRDIQDSNTASSTAAENALWTTSVWKKATTAILTHLSTFP